MFGTGGLDSCQHDHVGEGLMVEESPRRGASRRLAPGAAWDGAVIARAVERAAQERAAASDEGELDGGVTTDPHAEEDTRHPGGS